MIKKVLVISLFAASVSAQDSVLHPIKPCRILDTRITVPGVTMADRFTSSFTGIGALHDSEVRRYWVMCSATCYDDVLRRPVDLYATAILVNVIAVNATGPGHLMLYDSTLDDPLSANYQGTPYFSTINFQSGSAIATTTVIKLGQDQGYNVGDLFLPDLAIRATVSGRGKVHLILDLIGVYFER